LAFVVCLFVWEVSRKEKVCLLVARFLESFDCNLEHWIVYWYWSNVVLIGCWILK